MSKKCQTKKLCAQRKAGLALCVKTGMKTMSFKGGAGLWLSVRILSCSGKTVLSIGCCDTCWQNRRISYSFPLTLQSPPTGERFSSLSISPLTILVMNMAFFFFKEWLVSVVAQLGSTILRTQRSQSFGVPSDLTCKQMLISDEQSLVPAIIKL